MVRLVFISIMLQAGLHPHLWAQELTTQAPPASSSRKGAGGASGEGLSSDGTPLGTSVDLPDAPLDPNAAGYPVARLVQAKEEASDVTILADTQTTRGGHFTLDGSVVVTYGERTVQADHIEYDRTTGELEATGHLIATGGSNSERIEASHGSFNLKTQTGRFYDVKGSVGMQAKGTRTVYTSGNPFLFTGRLVVKTGPQSYDIYDGSVTSCQLPSPDWILAASHFTVSESQAKARNSIFRLINVPILYFPYVTHPLNSEDRQSGFLIPVFGQSSTKGLILGEQIYFVLGRSADMTVGAEYYSMRGWAEMATVRYRGQGDDFFRAHYSGLLDRRVGTANQGGEDAIFSGRRDFGTQTRVVADGEYLSSFIYRAAFTENFNQAVSSDIVSKLFGVRERNGYELYALADRYQGLKRIPVTSASGVVTPGEQVRIFHAPSLDLTSVDRLLGRSGFTWSLDVNAAGLKRVQPNFQTSGLTERFDLRPELAYPLGGDGWRFRPSVAVRETYYSRSRVLPAGITPMESTAGLNRADLELQVDARPPVIERTFSSGFLERLLHGEVRHTVEPAFTYRYVTGINNFAAVLRFDDRDIASNTNELEYGVTQRLFLRPRRRVDCPEAPVEAENPLLDTLPGGVVDGGIDDEAPKRSCGTRELVSWRLTQKYFFDPSFGGAVQNGRRNIFDSTLNLSGIAFLTEARQISPLVSRLRVRASERFDFEWDFDYDTGAKKFTADNFFVDVHRGITFAGLSYARLNAPGRAYSEGISSSVSDFSQMRVLLGFGMPTKPGLSVAANAGLDLNVGSVQYAALQTSYNWNCCGFSAEYRKYELGSVRNENAYRFNFTLANIGTAGNLKRAQRLF